MLVTLYLWTVVAAGSSARIYADWRAQGQFESVELCEKAKKTLGIPDANGRCVISKESK